MRLSDFTADWVFWLLGAPVIAWLIIAAFILMSARRDTTPKWRPSKKLRG